MEGVADYQNQMRLFVPTKIFFKIAYCVPCVLYYCRLFQLDCYSAWFRDFFRPFPTKSQSKHSCNLYLILFVRQLHFVLIIWMLYFKNIFCNIWKLQMKNLNYNEIPICEQVNLMKRKLGDAWSVNMTQCSCIVDAQTYKIVLVMLL